MKKLKKIALAIAIVAGICSLNVGKSAALNDNYYYMYTIKANYGNSYYWTKYRQTTNPSNPWKVQMTYSGEGNGTYTTYWLTTFNGAYVGYQASNTVTVRQGSAAVYTVAWPIASQKDVSLSAENNNYSGYSYNVEGYWDEETW